MLYEHPTEIYPGQLLFLKTTIEYTSVHLLVEVLNVKGNCIEVCIPVDNSCIYVEKSDLFIRRM